MKRTILTLAALAALFASPLALANCRTHTYFVDGRTVICTTCCYGQNCTTNCY